ncbi:MAG: LamG-like jellyroll fold domain-containing protein [Candidatus Latescibacterota bacterium]
MSLYIDGDIAGTATGEAGIGAIRRVQAVMGKLGPLQDERYLDGRLDDWRLWNAARTRPEIRRDMDRTLTGDEAGLAAYWKFDQVRGEAVFDLTANDQDGRICRLERSDFIAPVYVSGLTDSLGRYAIRGIYYGTGTTFTATPSKVTPIGRSLRLDGVDDYVDFPHRRLDLRGGYTVEGWFKAPGGGGDMTLFAAVDTASGASHVCIELQADGRLKLAHGSGEVVSTARYDHEYWHHWAATCDTTAATAILYVDGASVGTHTSAARITVLSAFVLGRQAPETAAQHFLGWIDEVRAWSYARSAEQLGGTLRQTLGGDENGLEGYWRLNEGDETVANDATGEGLTGAIQGGALWTDDIPLQEVFVHTFDPENRLATLNPSNTSVDRVELTDVSQIGVSGYVKYESTSCFIEGAEILVNGQSLAPPVYTDATGKFIAEFEPGATRQRISARYLDHQFTPPFIELPRITAPMTGFYLNDREKREVTGRVVGGSCGFPITPSQGEIRVTLSAIDGCVSVGAVPDAQTGAFSVRGLPPLLYQVTVDHPDPAVDAFLTGDTLSLELANGQIDFVYRSPPQVAITGFPQNTCGLRVMEMGQQYPVSLQVLEEYTAHVGGQAVVNRCAVASGTLGVVDGISDRTPRQLEFESGAAQYTLVGGYPNILAGGEHPYQKSIQVTATDDLGRNASVEEWAIVKGNRPRTTAFATTTPQIPLLILREPPGDGSYSYLEQGTTLSQSVSFAFNRGTEMGGYFTAHLGPDFTMSTGFIVETELEIDVTIDLTTEFGMSINNGSATEQTWTFTTNEAFETAHNGDVYVGGALNILYGVTDVLDIDPQTCQPYVFQNVILVPDGFATTYIYSEGQILGEVIPNLETIGDQASANRWRSFVQRNDYLKDNATFARNLSFDAGAVYEYSETSEVSKTQTVDFEMEVDQSFAMDLGIQVNGLGATGGFNVGTRMTVGQSTTTLQTHSNTVGFVLADDDAGDSYTVNVKHDPVYGTPVFETVSGFSSCPWYPGTVPFDEAQLTVSPTQRVDVPRDGVASYTLTLGNVSEADADRTYEVRVINQSNPDGAVIAVNGVVLEGGLPFFIPAGQQVQATLTVARGPTAYVYDGLQILLTPPCEYDGWLGGRGPLALSDTVTVSAHFRVPCSEAHVAVPEDNWLVTAAHPGNTLQVTLDGYDRTDPNLQRVELLCRRGSGDWFVAASRARDQFVDSYVIMPWDINPGLVTDGQYEVRRRAVCGAGLDPGLSPVVRGRIDRQPPRILGSADPADGILDPDDRIAMRVNEPVQCGDLNAGVGHLTLTNTLTSQPVDFTFTCGGSEVVISPNVQNPFIENQTLRAALAVVGDLYGNVRTTPLEWEFLVNRNPLEWEGPQLDNEVIYVDQRFAATRSLRNRGGSSRSFEITNVPAWLQVSPLQGTLAPGAAQTISFAVDGTQVGAGEFTRTVYAAGVMGDEPRLVDVRVLCYAPDWGQVDPANYQYSMNLTATVFTDGELSDDPFERVGVFAGDELRGLATVQHVPLLETRAGRHPYEVLVTVYSDQVAGEELGFRVWDASECRELGMVVEDYAFQANARLGTPTSPMTITATSEIISRIPLPAGWSWFSLNLRRADMLPGGALETLEPAGSDLLKSQTQFAQFVPGAGWLGPLAQTPLSERSMYMIRLSHADTVGMVGYAVDVETTRVALQVGWNWIGYLPQQAMATDAALASLPAATGDLVKSQTQFAQFVEGLGWVGSLRFMSPKPGYQLYGQFGGTLAYPFYEGASARPVAEDAALPAHLPAGWSVDPQQHAQSMTVVAVVAGDGLVLQPGDVLAAFSDGRCRGLTQAQSLPASGGAVAFLVVHGDEAGEPIRFALFDQAADHERFIPTELDFEPNARHGTAQVPLRLQTRAPRPGDPGFVSETFMLGDGVPNPFNPSTRIGYGLPREGKVDLCVYNLLGQKVATLVSGKRPAGYYYATWDGRNNAGAPLAAGVFFGAMVSGDFRAVGRVVLVK